MMEETIAAIDIISYNLFLYLTFNTEYSQNKRPIVDGNEFFTVCGCLTKHSSSSMIVDFMKCPPSAPYINKVEFVRCDNGYGKYGNYVPTGIDCVLL
jgi:hypothetical protein